MGNEAITNSAEFKEALQAHEWTERSHTGRIGSLLVVILLPAGAGLDWSVYRGEYFVPFLALRLIFSGLGLVLWFLHAPRFYRYQRFLGVPIAVLPAAAVACMIYLTHFGPNTPDYLRGQNSPYYAGLSLILLAVSVVVHASVLESVISLLAVLLMYFLACLPGEISFHSPSLFVTNCYFLILTGVIIVTGNYYFNRLRRSEFTARFELDKHKKALEENNAKLRELDQIKSRFFANISHELRTPLTLLIAPLETLLRRFALDDDTKELLVTMHSNGMRLLKLINDLLDLVRLESGRMETKLEPVDMAEFIKATASAARQVAEETFVDSTLGTVLMDRDKLDKIILNLVFNALKFTPSGGRVELRAGRIGERFQLTVTDTGMGISEKNLPHVFDRFWQADGSSKRKYQGMGIGLALVKELAQIQGGEVTVQSQEGKGTTFMVSLPYRQAEPLETPHCQVEAETAPVEADGSRVASEEWLANLYRRAELFPALTPLQESLRPVETSRNRSLPTLLVADDEPDMLRFLKSQLSPHYNVLEAVDGQQAIEKASQFLPDVILLDMMMPEKDGLQACREIRERTPTQSIPIVLLTARADEETKLKALEAGASDFLAKPFSTTELHVRIRNLVESHQYQRKVSKQNLVLESTIEQLKETESQLVQTEKLASLGRMSAGIIHEINNPLNFATTGLFTLRNKGKYLAPDQREEYQDILEDVEEGIKRVKNIVSGLRTFTHPDTESRDQVELVEVAAAALHLLSNEWKDKVRIEQNLPERQTVWANKNKLIQVLVNLLHNSLDALNAKAFVNEKPTIWIEGGMNQRKSLLVVRDNGIGIDPDHLNKVFDPFFTTKDVGKGMGLGLSICYRIVQECEGRISVRSEPGKFCEFTLEFPTKG
jgi:signal transduction histidine kinase